MSACAIIICDKENVKQNSVVSATTTFITITTYP